ncbi:hypothetical protein PMIT1327_00366 [Prochlorococcus marinus str. MIT 1327]|nr:hypothetical protein PMIT1327_00366 [Prochlorococcus marinus str. MIT 1327]
MRLPKESPCNRGVFHFFKYLTIGLKQPSIPGTIDLQKVALMPYLAGTNQK